MIKKYQTVRGLTVYCVDAFTILYHIAGWHSLYIIQNHSGWYVKIRQLQIMTFDKQSRKNKTQLHICTLRAFKSYWGGGPQWDSNQSLSDLSLTLNFQSSTFVDRKGQWFRHLIHNAEVPTAKYFEGVSIINAWEKSKHLSPILPIFKQPL